MSMAGMLERANQVGPKKTWVILVVGKTGAGKTTFIEDCTDENYLQKYKDDSSKSHTTSSTYSIQGRYGVSKACCYREIPGILDTPLNSAELLHGVAKVLVELWGTPVASIVYILNYEQYDRQLLDQELAFLQAWAGSNWQAPPSPRPSPSPPTRRPTALVVNRLLGPHASNPSIIPELRDPWRKYMGSLAQGPFTLGSGPLQPLEVVQDIIDDSELFLKFQQEILDEKKKLKKTTIGKIYTKQLDAWISVAKKEKSNTLRKSEDRRLLDDKIKALNKQRDLWKNLKFPPPEAASQRRVD